jgi:hypothetical protein
MIFYTQYRQEADTKSWLVSPCVVPDGGRMSMKSEWSLAAHRAWGVKAISAFAIISTSLGLGWPRASAASGGALGNQVLTVTAASRTPPWLPSGWGCRSRFLDAFPAGWIHKQPGRIIAPQNPKSHAFCRAKHRGRGYNSDGWILPLRKSRICRRIDLLAAGQKSGSMKLAAGARPTG